MNTEKLKEEIRLLERKLELLEQINKLQAIPIYPTPVYPTYPGIYPWWQVYPYPNWGVTTSLCSAPCGTTPFPNESISAYNGLATTDSTTGRKEDQFSYTN
ncbi:MAG: hypothetical protein LLG05_13075 [Porphyromonadaceae bacterium]|nr:hypothetical protein [Porphyromonadaceae bacterium]